MGDLPPNWWTTPELSDETSFAAIKAATWSAGTGTLKIVSLPFAIALLQQCLDLICGFNAFGGHGEAQAFPPR